MDGGKEKRNLGERFSKKLCFFVILIFCRRRGEKYFNFVFAFYLYCFLR